MLTRNQKWLGLILTTSLCLLLLGCLSLKLPAVVLAAGPDSLAITGDGVARPLTFTRAQLQAMEQYQHAYSVINTWPSKKMYVAKGVKLRDLLTQAGMTGSARLIKFTSSDGYTVTLTVRELLNDKRYYFPHFKGDNSKDSDGSIPGDPAGAEEVEPVLALASVEGSDNPAYMNDINSPLLVMGQRSVTEQTGNLFSKYVHKIEVLTTEPEKWDSPQANPGGGNVPAGTMVALSNARMDDDKIYYTTDGSTPNINSPVYNWIAKRWWSARADVLGMINHPVGPIAKNTVIKAITIGPGKADSDVATFSYQVYTPAPSYETAIPLKDVAGHWALDKINELVALGCISGYPDGTFRPDHTITRAEFATVLVKAFRFEQKGGKVFNDTAAHWAKGYIAAAADNGVVNGYDNGSFGPDDLITREQMAVMIVKAARLSPTAVKTSFADSGHISGWAGEALSAAAHNGIIGGYPDNTVRPQGSATRAEAVTVMVNALKK